MKKFFTIVLIFVAAAAVAGNEPSAVVSKTLEIRQLSWYESQALAWKSIAMKNPSNESLIYWYTASRYAQAAPDELKAIEAQAASLAPNSFASLLIKSLNQGYTNEGYEWLKRASEISSNHESTFESMLLHQERVLDAAGRQATSNKIYNARLVAPSLLNYSYNLLMSVDDGAFLFTEGEHTTIPLFVLQDVFQIRRDVQILNLDLLMNASYRHEKFAKAGLVWNPLQETTREQICALLPAQNTSRKFYFGLTVSRQHFAEIREQLYVVGLASQLSTKGVDNISLIRRNLEKRFLLDYLTIDFNGESEFAAGKAYSSNYLVPLLLLYEHEVQNGAQESAKKWEPLLKKLASESGKASLVESFLSAKAVPAAFIPDSKFDADAVEGKFRKVMGQIYANEYEVTNAEYNQFLEYLSRNNMSEAYRQYQIDLSKYEEPALSFMKGYHAARIPTKKERYFTNYPVVNISYEAALGYCAYLTEQYNNQKDRKYKKVKFRLPTLDEWQLASAGIPKATSWKLDENMVEVKVFPDNKIFGKEFTMKTVNAGEPDILYPWFKLYNFRNKALNDKGCSLGNFKYPETQKPCVPSKMTTADGFLLMSPVGAYFPNDIGLYDVVGNVAEMVSENGKACGGSWNDTPEASTIKSVKTFTGPDSSIGFRVFMEVIEQ